MSRTLRERVDDFKENAHCTTFKNSIKNSLEFDVRPHALTREGRFSGASAPILTRTYAQRKLFQHMIL
eukprot:7729915-Karenia_brevis.AAC.1